MESAWKVKIWEIWFFHDFQLLKRKTQNITPKMESMVDYNLFSMKMKRKVKKNDGPKLFWDLAWISIFYTFLPFSAGKLLKFGKIFFAKTWPIICLTFAYIMIFNSDQTLSSHSDFSKLSHFHIILTSKLKMAATSQVLNPDPNSEAQMDLHGG